MEEKDISRSAYAPGAEAAQEKESSFDFKTL